MTPLSWGQNYDQPAAGLAAKIAVVVKPGERIALTFRSLAPMSAAEAPAARAALERALSAQFVIEPAGPAVEVSVTISENLHGYLWVGEIRRGDAQEVVMEQGEAPQPRAEPAAAAITIEKKMLFEQDAPILDFAPVSAAAGAMAVLDITGISLHEGGQTPRLPIARVWPRDPRGRILIEGGTYRAYLPGAECSGTLVNGLSVICSDAVKWPLGASVEAAFAGGRNYFEGPVLPRGAHAKTLPPFYSAATVRDRGRNEWLIAGLDGRTYLYDEAFVQAGSWTGWGSDVAGVESECGAHSQALATKPGGGSAGDDVQAYEILDGTPQPVGDAAAFPGPVTALWPASERGSAFAVSHDLKSGRYAAFRLSITCGR